MAIAEYDSGTFNIGFIAPIWQDRFEALFELMCVVGGADLGLYYRCVFIYLNRGLIAL